MLAVDVMLYFQGEMGADGSATGIIYCGMC